MPIIISNHENSISTPSTNHFGVIVVGVSIPIHKPLNQLNSSCCNITSNLTLQAPQMGIRNTFIHLPLNTTQPRHNSTFANSDISKNILLPRRQVIFQIVYIRKKNSILVLRTINNLPKSWMQYPSTLKLELMRFMSAILALKGNQDGVMVQYLHPWDDFNTGLRKKKIPAFIANSLVQSFKDSFKLIKLGPSPSKFRPNGTQV